MVPELFWVAAYAFDSFQYHSILQALSKCILHSRLFVETGTDYHCWTLCPWMASKKQVFPFLPISKVNLNGRDILQSAADSFFWCRVILGGWYVTDIFCYSATHISNNTQWKSKWFLRSYCGKLAYLLLMARLGIPTSFNSMSLFIPFHCIPVHFLLQVSKS